MATNSKNSAAAEVETAEVLEDAPKVPHQTNVTAIKKDGEPKFYGEDDDMDQAGLVAKAKRLLKNKRVIGGASAAALLTIGVLVVRKRNTVDEQDNETPEA